MAERNALTSGNGRWVLEDCLQGDEHFGRFKGRDRKTGHGVLITCSPEPVRPLADLERQLSFVNPRVVPLLFAGPADFPHAAFVFIEPEPDGLVLVEAHRELPPPARVGFLLELAAVVAASHERAEYFGFLRPELIYVGDVEAGGDVWLVPRAVLALQAVGPQNAGPILFEHLYLAHECANSLATGPAADVASLSILAYWLLSGRHPYPGSYAEHGFAWAYDQRAPVPSRFDVPDVVEAGLSRKIADRPTLAEWVAGIQKLVRSGV